MFGVEIRYLALMLSDYAWFGIRMSCSVCLCLNLSCS